MVEIIMNALDSPLDALAFDYVSFGIFTVLNNLWTWLALLTAAVSFWRFRNGSSTGSCSNNCIDSRRAQPVLETSSQPAEAVSAAANNPSPSTTSSSFSNKASSSSRPSVFEVDGITKGKFITYYVDDRDSSSDGNDESYGEDDELKAVAEWERESAGHFGWPESWVQMRMGEMGWYRSQNLTAINGNVIRLWDEVTSVRYNCGRVSIW